MKSEAMSGKRAGGMVARYMCWQAFGRGRRVYHLIWGWGSLALCAASTVGVVIIANSSAHSRGRASIAHWCQLRAGLISRSGSGALSNASACPAPPAQQTIDCLNRHRKSHHSHVQECGIFARCWRCRESLASPAPARHDVDCGGRDDGARNKEQARETVRLSSVFCIVFRTKAVVQ